MKLKKFARKKVTWLSDDLNSLFLSTRIRIARNVEGFLFPNRLTSPQQLKLRGKIFQDLKKIDLLKKSLLLKMEELDTTDRRLLLERHLASSELVFSEKISGLLISQNEIINIMINEEDHLRIQIFGKGLELFETLLLSQRVENEISQKIKFAYDDEFGYLTACPTNVGTGLRISFLTHLAELVLTNHIGDVMESLSRIGLVMRGFYGEATKPLGDFFQISNQITLGVNPEEIIEKLLAVSRQLNDACTKQREELLKKSRIEIEDRVFRSFAILKESRKISFAELMQRISDIRLGLRCGFEIPVTGEKLNEIFFLSQPAHIEARAGKKLSALQRDVFRSAFIKECLKK